MTLSHNNKEYLIVPTAERKRNTCYNTCILLSNSVDVRKLKDLLIASII